MEENLSPEDYQKLLQEKDKIIESLRAQIERLTSEKDEMIESFTTSTNMLIERIKDLEAQKIGYRPQTANILSGGINIKVILSHLTLQTSQII